LDKPARPRLYQKARARVSFVRKSCPADFPGTGSRARRATDLHFHGARLANAYCIYLLASKVNLPAPVHESHAHIHGRVSAGRAHTRMRPRARARVSQRLRAPRASPGAQEVSRARARRLKGIHFSNARDEPREKPTRSFPRI